MNAFVVMHMLHGHAVLVVKQQSLAISTAPPLSESMLEPMQLHCECLPALPSIAQTEPWPEASELY